MVLSSALKGHTNAKKRSEEVGERAWKKNTTQAGPVCHLTSPWSVRLRAAHFGAAQGRVRRRKLKGLKHRKVGWQNLAQWSSAEPPQRFLSSNPRTHQLAFGLHLRSFAIFSMSGWSCRAKSWAGASPEERSFVGGADADRLASHRRYSRSVHRPRLKRQRVWSISGCLGPKSVALFQGSALSGLERPDSFGGPR